MSTIREQKLELLEWLAALEDKAVIQELIKLKNKHYSIDIELYNLELEAADEEISRGDFLTHEAAEKEIRSWREK